MKTTRTDRYDDAAIAHDYLLELGKITVKFAEVERAPRYPSGNRENDLEHSFHLAISAVELAADFYPELDIGLVAQFSLVHDLPESEVGDTWTFGISDEARAKKEHAEKKASEKLSKELPPYTAELLRRYEEQIEPEARFVRLVDKLTPAIINIMAGDANTFIEDHGIPSYEKMRENHEARASRLRDMFPEFDFVHMVRELISKTSAEHIYKIKK
jgi:putative hydrolase of HD superfamily